MSEDSVLVVEANPEHEAETLLALAATGVPHTPVVARDGVEALDYLLSDCDRAGGPGLPCVVLLALKLQRLDGIEVLRRIRGDRRTEILPVVVLTSSREDADVVHSYMIGANGFVRKQRDPALYREVISNVLRYWVSTNVRPPRRA